MSEEQELVKVDKKHLENLEECTDFLRILLFSGVKDWQGYSDAVNKLQEFKKLKGAKQ